VNWTEEQLAEWIRQRQMEKENPLPAPSSASDDPEDLIEAECTSLLEQDGWRALRTDPVSDRSRGKGFGEIGMADHLYMRPRKGPDAGANAEVLWIEYKRYRGPVRKGQIEWHTRERGRGFATWIAGIDFVASVAGFQTHYEKSGLMRRARWW